MDHYIQSGDVFVKKWGQREIIHVFLERGPEMAKHQFIRQTGNVESTWSRYRNSYESGVVNSRRNYRYIGRVPAGWRDEVVRLMKEGR